MNRLRRILMLTALIAGGATITGCATMGVEPWERDLHARADMAWEPDSLEAKRESHIYFSKEASSGGRGFAGGGCGCN